MEQCLDYVGRPYRLFPTPFSELGVTSHTVDSSREEVVVLKLHGSIDWFDRSSYAERLEIAEAYSHSIGGHVPPDPVFGPDSIVQPKPLVYGPRPENDPLRSIYRVLDPGRLYTGSYVGTSPFLLSPSYSKILYANPLKSFWHGLGTAGGLQLGMGIIGFSLPAHDEYVKQVLYRLCRNYTNSWWEEDLIANRRKLPLRLVDYRTDESSRSQLRQNYRFLNWDRTEAFFGGFDSAAVDFLFGPARDAV